MRAKLAVALGGMSAVEVGVEALRRAEWVVVAAWLPRAPWARSE
jgi:hypothetical protein